MESLSCDFETRSTVDLRAAGVYRYAEYPTTDILCMAFAFGDEDVEVWRPGQPLPARVLGWVDYGHPLRAHHAAFERILWRDVLGPRYGFPVPKMEQWYCSAAEAAAMALPRHLGRAAQALGVEQQKDDGGYRLMMQMCKPRKARKGEDPNEIHWWDDEDRMSRLIEYCKQDVRTERAISKRLRPLGKRERAIYLLDQRINDRGVRLDVPLIEAAQQVVKRGLEDANASLDAVTDGAVSGVTKVADLTRWLQEQGVDVADVRKSTIRDLLADSDVLDDAVEDALTLRAEAGKSSTSKLKAMQACRCSDDRARGLILYHGASTGRWSGKLIQPQNFPRGTVKDVEDYIPLIQTGEDGEHWQDPPLAVVSSLLRSMLIASEGHRLIAGDFSQVEARVLGWLAGEPFGDLEYERMAAAIYGVTLDDVTPEMRQVGKFVVLGCGFGMGAEKFALKFQEATGIQLNRGECDDEGNLLPGEVDEAQRAVSTYRERKARIKQYWYDVEAAAVRAALRPGEVHAVGAGAAVRYVVRGQFLWCILPSGRPLAYALPRVEDRETPWGEMKPTLTYMGVNTHTRKWQRNTTYGGHLVENIVQAVARDLMAEAMLRVEEAGYRAPVLTVHDEVVCDTLEGVGSLAEFLTLLRTAPKWAEGLTIEAEGWEGERYRK